MKHSIILTAVLLTFGVLTACANNGNTKKDSQTDEPATVIELTSEDFNKLVYDIKSDTPEYLGNKPAIVDFNATWCGPCRQISPILEELAAEYGDQIVIYKVDVDKCRDVATAFSIQSIPAIFYIPLNGEPQMTVGSRSKAQFKEEIEKLLLAK